MKPHLTAAQGRLLRALVLSLSNGGKDMMTPADAMVVESITSTPWASVTFSGARHAIVARLPAGTSAVDFDGDAIALHDAIVAVERVAWAAQPDGVWLALDLLTVDLGGAQGVTRA